jgi:hypothetical protein
MGVVLRYHKHERQRRNEAQPAGSVVPARDSVQDAFRIGCVKELVFYRRADADGCSQPVQSGDGLQAAIERGKERQTDLHGAITISHAVQDMYRRYRFLSLCEHYRSYW